MGKELAISTPKALVICLLAFNLELEANYTCRKLKHDIIIDHLVSLVWHVWWKHLTDFIHVYLKLQLLPFCIPLTMSCHVMLTYNLNRHFRRDLKLYVKQIPCKVALIHDSLNMEVLRNHTLNQTDVVGQKPSYPSMSKPVPLSNLHFGENIEQSEISDRTYSWTPISIENSSSGHLMPSFTLKPEEYNFSSSKLEKSGNSVCLQFYISWHILYVAFHVQF